MEIEHARWYVGQVEQEVPEKKTVFALALEVAGPDDEQYMFRCERALDSYEELQKAIRGLEASLLKVYGTDKEDAQ